MENSEIYTRILKSYEKQSFLAFIGAKLVRAEKGIVVISSENRDCLLQQQGLIHGGVVTTLADVAGGYAALSTVPEHCEVLTVELKINFIRPANTQIITATGRVLKNGKNLVVVESTVTDENQNLIAKMLGTMFVTKK